MTTRFERHQDNIGEIISAEHVNELQDVINANEQDILLLKDTDFENHALWLLANEPSYHRLWVDTFGDTSKVDIDKSIAVVHVAKDRRIQVRQDESYGELYSELYVAEKPINNVMLLAYTFRPSVRDNLIFEINIGETEWENIPLNEDFAPVGEGESFQLRAKLARVSVSGPSIFRWALLWG